MWAVRSAPSLGAIFDAYKAARVLPFTLARLGLSSEFGLGDAAHELRQLLILLASVTGPIFGAPGVRRHKHTQGSTATTTDTTTDLKQIQQKQQAISPLSPPHKRARTHPLSECHFRHRP